MKILPVQDRDGLAEFIEFPWKVYANDPSWIPPLREQVFFELSGASAFSRYGRHQLFLCEADGQLAGRIAALINPKLVDGNGNLFGQLGYFECIDDSGIAAALVEAGIGWLRTQGAHQVLGPMNGGAHRLHRFMTRGFDRSPFLFEPRNPPYYPKLFEKCGFIPAHRWFSYDMNREGAASVLNQYDRILTRRPPPGHLEPLSLESPQEATARIHRLLAPCWSDHFGYTSLDLEEFAEGFRGGLSIVSPGGIAIYVENGRDAGFLVVYPDYSADVRALAGHAAGWGKWLGQSHPKRAVLYTTALIPEARKSSVAMASVAYCFRQPFAEGFEEFIPAIVVEGYLGRMAEQTREYTLYVRSLT